VDDTTSQGELATRLCRPVRYQGRRVRAINPHASDDGALLEAISRGEFTLNGLRNRDIRALLFPKPPRNQAEQKPGVPPSRRPTSPVSALWSAATPISPPSAPASAKTCSPPPSVILPRSEQPWHASVIRCMLACYLRWHMRQRLAPMLFDDTDKEATGHHAPLSAHRHHQANHYPAEGVPTPRRQL
jgi:hypothetical protein